MRFSRSCVAARSLLRRRSRSPRWRRVPRDFEALVVAGERAERTLERYRQCSRSPCDPDAWGAADQKITADQLAALIVSRRTIPAEGPRAVDASRDAHADAEGVRAGCAAGLHRGEPGARAFTPTNCLAGERRVIRCALSRGGGAGCSSVPPDDTGRCLPSRFTRGCGSRRSSGLPGATSTSASGSSRVRAQLSRGTKANPPRRVELKTKAGRRDIALARQLEPYLREQLQATELATGCLAQTPMSSRPPPGSPLNRNNVAKRGLDKAADAAGLNDEDCRSWASMTCGTPSQAISIRAGVDPVRASRQLGHARPSITLDIYAHEFDRARGSTTSGTRSTPPLEQTRI